MKYKNYLYNIRVLLTNMKFDESFIHEASIAATLYSERLEIVISHRGRVEAARHFKLLHRYATAKVLGTKLPDIPFCKMVRGWPKDLLVLRPLLESSSREANRVGLTCTRIFESIYTKPVWERGPIVDPPPVISSERLAKFSAFADKFCKKFHPGTSLKSDSIWGHMSMGPNGPSIPSSHIDARAVMQDSVLFNALKQLATLTDSLWLIESLKFNATYTKLPERAVTGRVALIPQGGAKTRVIAIGDFWSQNILYTTHEFLMSCLKTLETDGTYNQDDAFERIQRLTKGVDPIYSIDLSRATDRFPVVYLQRVISAIFGKDFSIAWKDVMTSRDFLAPDKTFVRWGAGQPLGLLSSWASFALTNHIVIEWLASELGFTRFRSYAVLGDDVVIWSEPVAMRYKEFLTECGVSVSEGKSIVSTGGSQFEFAMRVSKEGLEYSGLTYNLMEAKRISDLFEFYRMCHKRGLLPPEGIRYFPGFLSENRRALLLVALWAIHPRILAPGNIPGLPSHLEEEFRQKMNEVIRYLKIEALQLKKETLENQIRLPRRKVEFFKARGIEVDEALFGRAGTERFHSHPVVMKILQDMDVLLRTIYEIDDLDHDPSTQLPIQYLPCIELEPYFGDKRKLKAQYVTTLCAKAWIMLKPVWCSPEQAS